MSEIAELMRQIALGAVRASCPAEVRVGTTVTSSPLSVRLDTKLVIGEPFLLIPQGFTAQAGDVLALLRVQGGQKYLILSKL